MAIEPELVLYTNHNCPWAHRVHIALAELGIQYKEQIIDLSVPRTPEYLKINPRGLVPSLSYNGEIITESAVVAQFLVDLYSSHLLAPSNSYDGALQRAKIRFFVDTYFDKVNSYLFKGVGASSDEAAEEVGIEFVNAVVKELEPVLSDAAPFFGGSDKLTFAEVLTGSFVLRLFSAINFGLLPASLGQGLQEKAPNFHRWSQTVIKHPSVTQIYNEGVVVEGLKRRFLKR